MIRAIVIKRLTDDNGAMYKIGDRVRIKIKPPIGCGSELATEYIGTIKDITPEFVIICHKYWDEDAIKIDNIDKIRFAVEGENFENTWDF